MKNLLYIYKKSKKRIQLIYFLKYKKQVALLKYKQYKNKSFISTNNNSNYNNYNNYNACYRLYNGLKIKQDNIDKLSQRFLQDEAEKYPYFPEINKYDLIYKNYYLVNNIPIFENKSQNKNKYIIKTEIPNPNNKNMHYNNTYYDKISDEEGSNHYFTSNDYYNNIYDENINLNSINNNYINKNKANYDSIIKKKTPLLDELDKEEKKIKNTTTSKIMDYKNTIPNNYKKIFKKNSGNSTKINKNIPKKFYEKKSEENYKNYNLTSYYPSPVIKKDLDKNSNHNLLLNVENSNYTQSKKNDSFINNNIVLSPNDNINNRYNHYSSKTEFPLEIVSDYNNKDNKKSNSYKFLPNSECSLSIEPKKNKTNLNSKRNNKYNKLDIKNGKNKISYASNNRVFNSIGIIDNSLSTNFIDKQSINDNHTISANDNNQHSIVYNKNKNISYTFPKKYNKDNEENNINLSGENYNNKIYFKKINSYKRPGKKKHKKVFNRIVIEKKRDNITSNTIKTDSSSKNPKIKKKVSFKEKTDYLIIGNDLFDEKKLSELKIASGEVNENVNIKKNKQDKMLSTSQKSEHNTIQSLSDSKILEIAKYYLNDEETVDKIEIGDILLTKNNKSNIYNKKK